MRQGWWWQEPGEDVLFQEEVLGAAVFGVPLSNVRDEDQGFVLVVTNLRLALMLQPRDSAFSSELESQESPASGRPGTFVAEYVGRTPGAMDSPHGRESAWVDARSRWDSLSGVWNVVPLGMIFRVTSPLDDSFQRNQTPGRSRQTSEAASTPTLAPALPLFSPPAHPGGFLSPRVPPRTTRGGASSPWAGASSPADASESKAASRGGTDGSNGSGGLAEGASIAIECYDLRRVELYFETADAALRVLHLLRGQPFSPERFLHRQLQQVCW